jgi:hypothetical protein
MVALVSEPSIRELTNRTWKMRTSRIRYCRALAHAQSPTLHHIGEKVHPAIYQDSTAFHFWRFLNITFAFPGMGRVFKIKVRGACFPSSNLMSYVIRTCASKVLTSLTAKKRPGLIEGYK